MHREQLFARTRWIPSALQAVELLLLEDSRRIRLHSSGQGETRNKAWGSFGVSLRCALPKTQCSKGGHGNCSYERYGVHPSTVQDPSFRSGKNRW